MLRAMTPQQRVAGVAALFDRTAQTYDSVGVPWFGPIAQALLDELDLQPGERVLDVGCGRGAVLQRAADAVGATGTAVGVDVAPQMVRLTAELLADRPQVQVRVADATGPDLPPASFDVVASSLVLFFLPDPAGALATWVPLLVPGGRLGLTTFGPQDRQAQAVDELFTRWLPQGVLDARASGRRGPFASDTGMEQLLTDAGLVGVRTVTRRQDVAFDDAAHWERWSRSHAQRQFWDAVPEPEQHGVREGAAALLEECRGSDGRISLWQDVRITLGRRP